MSKAYFWVGMGLMLSGCMSVSPYDTSPDKSAHLIGRRAMVSTQGKEFVYFAQIDKLDMRDRWSDYPHDVYIPPGYHTVVVTCEWYTNGPPLTVAHRIRQRFIMGHEYDFSSRLINQGMCETTMVDLTAEQRKEANKEAQPAKKADKKALTK